MGRKLHFSVRQKPFFLPCVLIDFFFLQTDALNSRISLSAKKMSTYSTTGSRGPFEFLER